MAEIIIEGSLFKVGCTDPLASNYDPTATEPCNGCCEYGIGLDTGGLSTGGLDTGGLDIGSGGIGVGTLDPTSGLGGTGGGFTLDPGGVGVGTLDPGGLGFGGGGSTNCSGPFSITIEGQVLGVNSSECCNGTVIDGGLPPEGYEYYWDGQFCWYIQSCPTDLTCVDCNSFDWWNDKYISTHGGQSLSVSNPVLWQKLVDLVSNSGETFYVQTTTGDLLDPICCQKAKGTFNDGICFCGTGVIEEEIEPKCISNLQEFLEFISTTQGYNYFVTNSLLIGGALGLTNQQINFIVTNINNTGDSNNNGISDSTEARLILSNALNITGGFYVNFGSITKTPTAVNKGTCDSIGGYWFASTASNTGTGTVGTGTVGTGIVGTSTVGTGSLGFNTLGGTSTLDTGGLGFDTVGTSTLDVGGLGFDTLGTSTVGTGGLGFSTLDTGGLGLDTGGLGVGTLDPGSGIGVGGPAPGGTNTSTNGQCMCKPIVDQCDIDITEVVTTNTFDFYNNPIQIVTKNGSPISEACCNRLIKDYNLPWEWQKPYCYAKPKDDCLPVVFSLNDKDSEIKACESDLELSMWVYFGKPENPCQPIPDPPDNDVIVISGETCNIVLTPNLGSLDTGGLGVGTLEVGTSVGVGTSIGALNLIDAAAPNPNGNETLPSNNVCCYNNQNPILARITTTNPILNPFLVQVKEYNSNNDYFNGWVELKATLPTSGLTLNFGVNLEIYQGLNCCCNYDIFVDDIRVNCAKQESILIVNNIKCPGFELTKVIDNKKSWVYNPGLPDVGISDYDNIERGDGSFGTLNGEGTINRTFAPSLDADLPWRYTDYWAQSSVLEKHSNLVLNSKEFDLTFDMCADCPISASTLGCPDGYTLSGNTNVCYNMSGTTSAITITTVTYLSLYNLENYKKTFQSFWIPFMEQFVPATTIWVAGERWCNEPCTIIDVCDYDFELTDAQISIEPVPDNFFSTKTGGNSSTTLVPELIGSEVSGSLPLDILPSEYPNMLLIEDLGLVTSQPIILTQEEYNIDLTAYKDKFEETIIETVIN